jgi:dUTP pyrophosphatase
MVLVKYKVLPHGKNLPAPTYATSGSSGLDLCAADNYYILSTLYKSIPTGISIQLPKGFEAQIRPRSGLAAKYGITILNSPGTIDSDYRGEISVILINHSDKAYEITRGDRIAQMIIMPVPTVTLKEVIELNDTDRGECGFGSTGN